MKSLKSYLSWLGLSLWLVVGAHGQSSPGGSAVMDGGGADVLEQKIAETEAKRDAALEKLARLQEQLREQEQEIASKTSEVALLKAFIAKKTTEIADESAEDTETLPEEVSDRISVPNGFISNVTPYVVVIEGDEGSGTGFLCRADGEVWVYTAAHVLSGNSRIKVRDYEGRVYQEFEFLECAEDADLVRLKPKSDDLEGLTVGADHESPAVGDVVVAIGNSLGAGSLSGEPGKVISVDDDMWEVDSEIIPGNSGGPVLSLKDQKVIGIVTHLMVRFRGESSLGEEKQTKRYAARLDKEREWRRMPVARFVKEWKYIEKLRDESSIAWACGHLMHSSASARSHSWSPGQRRDGELRKIAESIVAAEPEHFHVQLMDDWIRKFKDASDIGRTQVIDDGNDILERIFDDIRLTGKQPSSGDFSWFHRQAYEDEVKWRRRLTRNN